MSKQLEPSISYKGSLCRWSPCNIKEFHVDESHVSSVINEDRIQSALFFVFQQKENLCKLRSQQKSFENL